MKTGDFDHFVLSVFDVGDIKSVTDAIEDVWKEEFEEGKMKVTYNSVNISDYYDPESGGAHFPKFSCWKSRHYSDKVFFASNYDDGLMTTCLLVRERMHCNLFMCTFSHGSMYGIYSVNSDGRERIVHAIKEDRWVFFESGEPLPIEDVSLYRNKYKRKRINNEIIVMYLKRMGIMLGNIDDGVTASATYEQLAWKSEKKSIVEDIKREFELAEELSYEIEEVAYEGINNKFVTMRKK